VAAWRSFTRLYALNHQPFLTTDPGGTKRFQKETASQVQANPGACRQSRHRKIKIDSVMGKVYRVRRSLLRGN
jgi:hypothetical protein